jgi:hypothetical protein
MNSAKIVRQMRENTERPHKPLTRMIMIYEDKAGVRHSNLIKMGTPGGEQLIQKTLRWASYNGIEVTFRPV